MSDSGYSATIEEFLTRLPETILGFMSTKSWYDTTKLQGNAWDAEIRILQEQLKSFKDGRIIFEYTIPRKGKRIDVVVLYKNIVFVLEFKCGDPEYQKATYKQVYYYADYLRNFHEESNGKLLVPIMISTEAAAEACVIDELDDRIIDPIRCNKDNIAAAINAVVAKYDSEKPFSYSDWEGSRYFPTPTIVELAQDMYSKHSVDEITRSDAETTVTTKKIDDIIEYSKTNGKFSICFVTGVPGAGKTLVGLNLAVNHTNSETDERAVYLSGNGPLVEVLQEALANDRKKQIEENGGKTSLNTEREHASVFIQEIYNYRNHYLKNEGVPTEHVVIFDEAQRAWTQQRLAKFIMTRVSEKENITVNGYAPNNPFPYSEPEFLIHTMDRHKDWAVIVCLVGGGQEIDNGEAGLPEWFDALRNDLIKNDWDVYITCELNAPEYLRGRAWKDMLKSLNYSECKELHLATSVRSFRTPDLAAFVNAVLDADADNAKELYKKITDNKYPIVITRDLNRAKEWVKGRCKGGLRYGIVASSGALRLIPEGIFVKNEVKPACWFLNNEDDIRSSYAMEVVATEFAVQGLEVEYSIVAWDADYRYDYENGVWTYNYFSGNKWKEISKEEKQRYLKNAYRVLLTRARRGMAIFIPEGSDEDKTRKRKWYDGIYNYLKEIGITELK